MRRRKTARRSDLATEVSRPGNPRQIRVGRFWIVLTIVVPCGLGVAVWAAKRNAWPRLYGYQLVSEFPHDPKAYCQGLVIVDAVLYESTGKYGSSSLRKVDLATGRVLKQKRLDRRYFGEGITIWGDRIIQLTWREHVALIHDKNSFKEVGRFQYEGEGWGLTHDGKQLILSDGTPTLRFIDPETFQVVRRLIVRNNGQPVRLLNELEFIQGEIFANVWHSDHILRISPATGEVTGRIDLKGLYPRQHRRTRDDVLNGIAYEEKASRLLVTGKNWSKLFEIRLVPK